YPGDVFGHVSLMTKLKNGKHQTQAIALTESEIWFLSFAQFQQLMQKYPEIEHLINSQLAEDIN
ncbi:cyclic nucleotide-binding domain-containing protein, partial [Synechocystis salina LEGE 06155]|nr:cyclic nucleotide-binding domain-containing protein [Synechocystis salina LEGE 06155]